MAVSPLESHVEALRACERCPDMHRPAISGGPVHSRVMLVGQAPGAREPAIGKPFAWTAGKKLFQWFEEHCSLSESDFRKQVYIRGRLPVFSRQTPQRPRGPGAHQSRNGRMPVLAGR